LRSAAADINASYPRERVDEMPDKEQAILLHFINVYLRDFKARKAYSK
jgi:hypothetical protein